MPLGPSFPIIAWHQTVIIERRKAGEGQMPVLSRCLYGTSRTGRRGVCTQNQPEVCYLPDTGYQAHSAVTYPLLWEDRHLYLRFADETPRLSLPRSEAYKELEVVVALQSLTQNSEFLICDRREGDIGVWCLVFFVVY